MFGFMRLITDLFRGWPFWFDSVDKEEIDKRIIAVENFTNDCKSAAERMRRLGLSFGVMSTKAMIRVILKSTKGI